MRLFFTSLCLFYNSSSPFFNSLWLFVTCFISLPFFSQVCDCLSSKFTFLCPFYSMLWLFFHLNFYFSVIFTVCCDFLLPKLIFYVYFTLACFEPCQVNIKVDTTEKFLYQVLVTGTICRQHLTNKISMKWLTQ